MTRRRIPTIPSLALALLALVLAGAAVFASLVRVLQGQDRTAVARETIAIPSGLRRYADDPASRYIPVADDPFFPGRMPPATRYQLAVATGQPTGRGSDPSIPTVLGTVVGANGSSFAIYTMNDAPPKTVRLGESVGGYRAETIERGRVVFVTPAGRRITVAINQAADTSAHFPSRRNRRRDFLRRFGNPGNVGPDQNIPTPDPDNAAPDADNPDDQD